METIFEENNLRGKTILWLGTSIPEGHDLGEPDPEKRKTYPQICGELLGATVINQALGASMCRANMRTGDFVGGNANNITRCLSQTLEEKEYLIEHWAEINPLLKNPQIYPDGLEAVKDVKVRPASFERKLLPFLDGTFPMPDLFVIDHGHNDTQRPSPQHELDILLEPTVANIRNGYLAEDTYMTKNGYANLKRFFGDLSGIPEEKFASFIASVNRNCFIGAMNFICTLILHYNPRARIVFLANLDNNKKELLVAQRKIAESWCFPLLEPGKKLGLGEHIIPGTAKFWDENGTTDLVQKNLYCKDNVHPHTDTTGRTIWLYGHIIAMELKNMVL